MKPETFPAATSICRVSLPQPGDLWISKVRSDSNGTGAMLQETSETRPERLQPSDLGPQESLLEIIGIMEKKMEPTIIQWCINMFIYIYILGRYWGNGK